MCVEVAMKKSNFYSTDATLSLALSEREKEQSADKELEEAVRQASTRE